MTQSFLLVPLGEAEDGAWGPIISGSDIYDPLGGGRHTPLVFLLRQLGAMACRGCTLPLDGPSVARHPPSVSPAQFL